MAHNTLESSSEKLLPFCLWQCWCKHPNSWTERVLFILLEGLNVPLPNYRLSPGTCHKSWSDPTTAEMAEKEILVFLVWKTLEHRVLKVKLYKINFQCLNPSLNIWPPPLIFYEWWAFWKAFFINCLGISGYMQAAIQGSGFGVKNSIAFLSTLTQATFEYYTKLAWVYFCNTVHELQLNNMYRKNCKF